MAIYHCSAKIIGRSGGRSAVAASAYRSGEKITNERDGITHDYTGKTGVVHSEILVPVNAPEWANDRSKLWNEVEQVEKSQKAQLAREIEVGLPNELNREQQIELCRDYSKEFANNGMVADYSIHDKGDGNPHAHIMLTMRPFDENGNWGAKQQKVYELDKDGNKQYNSKTKTYKCKSVQTTNWNEKETLQKWREGWAKSANLALERAGHEQRIDHRSNKERGIDKIPTIHEGVHARAMERKGIQTERGDINRNINRRNQNIEKIEREMKQKGLQVVPKSLDGKLYQLYRCRHRLWELRDREKMLRVGLRTVPQEQAKTKAFNKVCGREYLARENAIGNARNAVIDARKDYETAKGRRQAFERTEKPTGFFDKLKGRDKAWESDLAEHKRFESMKQKDLAQRENSLTSQQKETADWLKSKEPEIKAEQEKILSRSDNKFLEVLKANEIRQTPYTKAERALNKNIEYAEKQLGRERSKEIEKVAVAKEKSREFDIGTGKSPYAKVRLSEEIRGEFDKIHQKTVSIDKAMGKEVSRSQALEEQQLQRELQDLSKSLELEKSQERGGWER